MFLLILESLGSTELLFILVMALVFFGPRKLPQMSRSLGKSLAEFRRASEDFKQTWVREVSLEAESVTAPLRPVPVKNGSTELDSESAKAIQPPAVEVIAADRVVPHRSNEIEPSSEKYESQKPDETN